MITTIGRLLLMSLFLLIFTDVSFAKTPKILKLENLKPGTKAIGFSVFRGVEPEPFDVVLGEPTKNGGLDLILARLSGGPMETLLEKIGPIAGMSGSPIFIECGDNKITSEEKLADCVENGVLVGALSYSIGYFIEGGINFMLTPAEKMLGTHFHGYGLASQFSYPTTTSFDGKGLHNLMLSPKIDGRAVGENSSPKCPESTKNKLKPGSMISVYLADGPIPVGGSGTITWIDDDKIYAFGHSFFGTGMVSYPFVHVGVAATIQTPLNAYKIAGCHLDTSGVIYVDGAYEIAGVIGKTTSLLPLEIVSHFGNIEFSLKENIAFSPMTRYIITELPIVWAQSLLGNMDRLSLVYQARVVIKDRPEFFLKNVIPAQLQAKENPFRQVFGNIGKIFEGLEKTGTRPNVERVQVHIDFANNLKIWKNRAALLSQPSVAPGETVHVNIVLEELSTGELSQISVPVKVPADFLDRLESGDLSQIKILVQSGSKFTDKQDGAVTNIASPEHMLKELNTALNRQTNVLYVQQIMPNTKIERENNRALAKSSTKPPWKWNSLESGELNQLPLKENLEVVLNISSPLDHFIDFDASFSIWVESKEKLAKSSADKDQKKKNRKWFFLFLR